MIDSIQFKEPLWLLLILAPMLKLIAEKFLPSKSVYADTHLLNWATVSTKNHTISKSLSFINLPVIAWVCLCISLSGPRTINQILGDKDNTNSDIVIALDLSRSMQVTDVKPSRFSAATTAISQLIAKLEKSRVSIVLFSSTAHTLVPLTSDKKALSHYLNSIRADMLPNEGTKTPAALALGMEELKNTDSKNKKILLVSDGGGDKDNTLYQSGSWKRVIARLKKDNVKVYIWGIGTREGGGIPAEQGGWITDDNKKVLSSYTDSLHKVLSNITGGKYSKLNRYNIESLITEINNDRAGNSNPISESNNSITLWDEYYLYFFIVACLLFLLGKYRFLPKKTNSVVTVFFIVFSALLTIPSQKSYANSEMSSAYIAYQQGDYRLAASLYRQQSGYPALMGQASAVYKHSLFNQAINLYIQAALEASTDTLRADALFNLANTYYKIGDYATAAETYKDSLVYRPNDKATDTNLSLAIILKKQVEVEIRKISINRAGKGPRKAKLKDGTDTTGSKVSISDEDEIKKSRPNNASDIFISNNFALISRGIEFSTLSANQTILNTNDDWRYRLISSGNDQAYNINNEHKLWKRLFEIETGYPAPEDKPRIIDGVKPW